MTATETTGTSLAEQALAQVRAAEALRAELAAEAREQQRAYLRDLVGRLFQRRFGRELDPAEVDLDERGDRATWTVDGLTFGCGYEGWDQSTITLIRPCERCNEPVHHYLAGHDALRSLGEALREAPAHAAGECPREQQAREEMRRLREERPTPAPTIEPLESRLVAVLRELVQEELGRYEL